MEGKITADQLKNHISAAAESLDQIHNTFQQSTILTDSSIENTLKTSKVAKPLDEVPKLASLISAHATKLGLVFKPPIAQSTYKSCWNEIDSLVKYSILLISLLNQIKQESEQLSLIFVNELITDGLSIVESSIILINELNKLVDIQEEDEEGKEEQGKEQGRVKPRSSDQRLIGVGVVWESSESAIKTCKSGSSGVLRSKLKQTNKLVIDALKELQEWLENPIIGGGFDFEEDDDIFGLSFDEDDKTLKNKKLSENGNEEEEDDDDEDQKADDEVIKYGEIWSTKIQLIKLLISLLDKSIPPSKYNVKYSKGLDLLNEKRLKVNEYVDDLVASIVYDSDVESAKNASAELTKEINQIVELVRKLNNDDQKRCKWLDSWKAKYQEQ
jgi:hypothetical protein